MSDYAFLVMVLQKFFIIHSFTHSLLFSNTASDATKAEIDVTNVGDCAVLNKGQIDLQQGLWQSSGRQMVTTNLNTKNGFS